MNPMTNLDPQNIEAVQKAFDATVVGLINAEARIMDFCLDAAAQLMESRVQMSSVVHGPDAGPAANEHPGAIAIGVEIYKNVREALRNGPQKPQEPEGDDPPVV